MNFVKNDRRWFMGFIISLGIGIGFYYNTGSFFPGFLIMTLVSIITMAGFGKLQEQVKKNVV